jgi:uncharacterized protein YkwD
MGIWLGRLALLAMIIMQGCTAAGLGIHQPEAPSAGPRPAWLARFNAYREGAGLKPAKENRGYSDGDLKHAKYLVKNRKNVAFGQEMHNEDPAAPYYTAEGLEAARTSDVIPAGPAPYDDEGAIDIWLSGPFHALPMLDPDLEEVGYGRYCEEGECAAALRVGRDEKWARSHQMSMAHYDPERHQHESPYVYEMPVEAKPLSKPIEFPPDGAVMNTTSFNGGEWPNPLASCPGYIPPTGPALILQLGTQTVPEITGTSFQAGGHQLEHCVFNAPTYKNPDPVQAKTAQGILRTMGAVVMFPRVPLTTGTKYDVSIVAGERSYRWSFSVAAKPAGAPPPAPSLGEDDLAAGTGRTPRSSAWLTRINAYRAAAGAPALVENESFSDGDLKHAIYLVKNSLTTRPGPAAHTEDLSKPFYTPEGLEAAKTSDLISAIPGRLDAIDWYMTGPFHRLAILDPELHQAGFGRYCENDRCAVALRLSRRRQSELQAPSGRAMSAAPLAPVPPIGFPPDGSLINQPSYSGDEFPDALKACKGYRAPTGPPITLQLGKGVNTQLSGHSFSINGRNLEHCVFDASTYTSNNSREVQVARHNLELRGALVMIPRAPLEPGATYDVAITAGGLTYKWSIAVAPKAAAASR